MGYTTFSDKPIYQTKLVLYGCHPISPSCYIYRPSLLKTGAMILHDLPQKNQSIEILVTTFPWSFLSEFMKKLLLCVYIYIYIQRIYQRHFEADFWNRKISGTFGQESWPRNTKAAPLQRNNLEIDPSLELSQQCPFSVPIPCLDSLLDSQTWQLTIF